jgi:cyclophilin family peptidyl-prolyl cis-trans isomerase
MNLAHRLTVIVGPRPARPRRRRPRALLTALLTLLALAPVAGTTAERATGEAVEDDAPRVRLTTTLGTIDVALFPDAAPRTVANFLRLVDDGFYDGLIFHRVLANFVIQTGGYEPDMSYREPPRTVVNESFNGLANTRGTLAMARLSDPDSAEAQFFINVKDNPHLDAAPGTPGYTVFGEVVDGMDVVTEIELVGTTRRAGMAGVPETPVVIERAERLTP